MDEDKSSRELKLKLLIALAKVLATEGCPDTSINPESLSPSLPQHNAQVYLLLDSTLNQRLIMSAATHPELNAPNLLEGATRDLAIFASSLTFEDIPAEVVSYAKELILDNLGVVLFGIEMPWVRTVLAMVEEEGATPRSSILGSNKKTSPALAALVNSTGGHAFEFDEVHRDATFHPGSIILPVILALAEAEGGRSGRDLITATVAAYEVGCRVGMSCGSGLFFRGFHPQGALGVFAASVAASRILNFDAKDTQNALGIAASQAAGLMAAQEGAMVKRFHSGRAAQSGVYSALLARRSFTGTENALEAAFGGFLTTYSNKYNAVELTANLGKRWETLNVAYKPYSTVASIHTALDGFRAIISENKLKADDIESVDVGTGHLTYQHCAWKYKPNGVTAAQMNLFYPLALIAVDGDAGVNQFREDRLTDPQLLALIDRMTAHVSDELEEMGREYRHASTTTVKTKDGRVFERTELHRRGTRENPPQPKDVEQKFRTLATRVLPDDLVEKLVPLIRSLEDQASLEGLCSILTKHR